MTDHMIWVLMAEDIGFDARCIQVQFNESWADAQHQRLARGFILKQLSKLGPLDSIIYLHGQVLALHRYPCWSRLW